MLAVDTNVLVRIGAEDDLPQLSEIMHVMKDETLWVGVTVLLEAEWVLRSAMGYRKERFLRFVEELLASEQFEIEDEAAVVYAIDLCGEGADFADALHFARRPNKCQLITFDKHFATQSLRKTKAIRVLKSKPPTVRKSAS
jgi:predicted nucleic-acid-binding protein